MSLATWAVNTSSLGSGGLEHTVPERETHTGQYHGFLFTVEVCWKVGILFIGITLLLFLYILMDVVFSLMLFCKGVTVTFG